MNSVFWSLMAGWDKAILQVLKFDMEGSNWDLSGSVQETSARPSDGR